MRHLMILYRHRDLLWLWTLREVRVRYKQSALGVAWAVLQPLALTIVFTLMSTLLLRIDTAGIPYPVFAYAAMVPWTFFSTSLSFGIPSLINNMNLVTKIYFPREVLPLASIGAALLDFGIALLVFGAMLVAFRIRLSAQILWIIPLLLIQLGLTIGVTLFSSAVLVFFRDVRFVLPLLVQVWMYATPVFYPIELVPEWLRPYYLLNPMAGIIDGYRRTLVMGLAPQAIALWTALGVSAAIFVLGYVLFKRVEPLFADLI